MKLKRLEIRKLYGTFTKTVDFDESLNLLVGINGSGKTSILNCIDWLLKPDLPRLASTKFQLLRLRFNHQDKDLSILAKHEGGRLTIVEESGQLSDQTISVDLIRPLDSIINDRDFEEACQLYSGLSPEKHERELWRALHKTTKPLSILLDRTISAEAGENVFFEGAEGARGVRIRKKAKSPIDKVVEVTGARYAAYRERINSHNDALKARIVSSALNSPFRLAKADQAVSLDEITRLESKVTLLIASMDATSSTVKNVEAYFRDAKQLATHAKKEKELNSILSVQFRQLNDLAAAFKDYEKKASASYEILGSYLESLNSFFRESKKQVGFNDQDGKLGFQFLNASGQPSGHFFGVDRLSSGEKQILILISFLAFVSKNNQVFVVDEPELSLHPKWQQNFLQAVLSQAPADTQIILATHSPEIVAKHRANCIILDA